MPAGEIEAAVREMLGEPTAWRPPRSSDLPNNAERLAVAWRSLDKAAQDGLLPHLMEQILLRRRMTEVRLTLCDSAIARLEAKSPAPGGQLAGEIESGRFLAWQAGVQRTRACLFTGAGPDRGLGGVWGGVRSSRIGIEMWAAIGPPGSAGPAGDWHSRLWAARQGNRC